jgi:pimeloyl-ACP methyl ester carboxylesterase
MFTAQQVEEEQKRIAAAGGKPTTTLLAISKLLTSFGTGGKKDTTAPAPGGEDGSLSTSTSGEEEGTAHDTEQEGGEDANKKKAEEDKSKKKAGEDKNKKRTAESANTTSSASTRADNNELSTRDIEQDRKEAEKANSKSNFFSEMAGNFMKLAATKPNSPEQDNAIADIVRSVCERSEQGAAQEETASLKDLLNLIGQYKGKITEVAAKYGNQIDLRKLSPNAVGYYLEMQDETKNPSWRRRRHRFCPGLPLETCHELNDALDLALLAYADTADEIRLALGQFRIPYELAYCNVKSSPGQPAHFVAVKRDQTSNSKVVLLGGLKKVSRSLKVLIGVRGTKTPADAITDLLCDTVDYRGGKAHSMILESGQYIATKHLALLEQLRDRANKKTIKVTLVGHSLGAGAASIAGMELRALAGTPNNKIIVQQVIGFGCPALVSKELAEQATYITTVINHDDVVPRMSGAAMANLLLDMMAFNWLDYARRDIEMAVLEIKQRAAFLLSESMAQKILATIHPLLERHLASTRLAERPARIELEVFPPGNCIHFYDDGRGISSAFVPNTFFTEIDVSRRMVDGELCVVGPFVSIFFWFSCTNAHTFTPIMTRHYYRHRPLVLCGLPAHAIADYATKVQRPSFSLSDRAATTTTADGQTGWYD